MIDLSRSAGSDGAVAAGSSGSSPGSTAGVLRRAGDGVGHRGGVGGRRLAPDAAARLPPPGQPELHLRDRQDAAGPQPGRQDPDGPGDRGAGPRHAADRELLRGRPGRGPVRGGDLPARVRSTSGRCRPGLAEFRQRTFGMPGAIGVFVAQVPLFPAVAERVHRRRQRRGRRPRRQPGGDPAHLGRGSSRSSAATLRELRQLLVRTGQSGAAGRAPTASGPARSGSPRPTSGFVVETMVAGQPGRVLPRPGQGAGPHAHQRGRVRGCRATSCPR